MIEFSTSLHVSLGDVSPWWAAMAGSLFVAPAAKRLRKLRRRIARRAAVTLPKHRDDPPRLEGRLTVVASGDVAEEFSKVAGRLEVTRPATIRTCSGG